MDRNEGVGKWIIGFTNNILFGVRCKGGGGGGGGGGRVPLSCVRLITLLVMQCCNVFIFSPPSHPLFYVSLLNETDHRPYRNGPIKIYNSDNIFCSTENKKVVK